MEKHLQWAEERLKMFLTGPYALGTCPICEAMLGPEDLKPGLPELCGFECHDSEAHILTGTSWSYDYGGSWRLTHLRGGV